jgi:hypothetical protein
LDMLLDMIPGLIGKIQWLKPMDETWTPISHGNLLLVSHPTNLYRDATLSSGPNTTNFTSG